MKRTFTVKPKQAIKADTETPRQRISRIEDAIAHIKWRLQTDYLTDDERSDLQMDLAELEEQLNFAWQDDEADYNYALERQEFNPDGSLKYYDVPSDYEDEDAYTYTVRIWHEVDPGSDAVGPVALDEIFDFVADSPQHAVDYAKKAWDGPIDRIEVIAIDDYPLDKPIKFI